MSLTRLDGALVSAMVDDSQFLHSSLREKVIEHLFLGDLLKCLWLRGRQDIEVLRAEIDFAGYDLVLGCNGATALQQLRRAIALQALDKSTFTPAWLRSLADVYFGSVLS